jgi:hypothetical protein
LLLFICHALHNFARHQSFDKPYRPPVWAGGPLASIIEWLVSAVVLTLLLNASIIKPSRRGNVFEWIWSFWFLGELFNEIRHAYAPSSVWAESTQFVYTTGINPNFVALPLAGLFLTALGSSGALESVYRIKQKMGP